MANDQGPTTNDDFGVSSMPPDWKTYRTRFVVRAKQLTEPFTFTDSDGREHHGRTGDYVIESREGLRISRREIFEDVYVAMEAEIIPSRSPDGDVSKAQAGGHGFSRAEINGAGIGALAPVQPLANTANLPV